MKLKDSAFVHSLRSNVKGILLMSVAAFLLCAYSMSHFVLDISTFRFEPYPVTFLTSVFSIAFLYLILSHVPAIPAPGYELGWTEYAVDSLLSHVGPHGCMENSSVHSFVESNLAYFDLYRSNFYASVYSYLHS